MTQSARVEYLRFKDNSSVLIINQVTRFDYFIEETHMAEIHQAVMS